MKILIIQLARLGDIYLTWPLLRGLRDNYPEATIDVLVRPRFAKALDGLNVISNQLKLPMQEIFEPLFEEPANVDCSLEQIDNFSKTLRASGYDWIINVSFSPVSSYLTHLLSAPETKITGYTRFTDGFLSIPDDTSAYFFGQVGIGKYNRIHIADIFCLMTEVQMKREFRLTNYEQISNYTHSKLSENYLVIHVGASQATKIFPAFKWRSTVNHIRAQSNLQVVLIGAPEEFKDAEFIAEGSSEDSILNLVGQTELRDLFVIIGRAKLLIGCDSAPIHIASLTNTPTLNLSFASVNFWETGPLADHSQIIYGDESSDIASETVARAGLQMLNGVPPEYTQFIRVDGIPTYRAIKENETPYSWKLIQAIYMESPFPQATNPSIKMAFQQLIEINLVMLQQLAAMQRTGDIQRFREIYERGEEIMMTITKLVPDISPLIHWYNTEKVRIGPDGPNEVFKKTKHIHNLLQDVLTMEGLNESYINSTK